MAQVQEIVDLVLQALAANAKTIDDLTEALSIGDSDYIELNGGRKLSVARLAELVSGGMVEITHAELKALRDGGALVAGTQYRITDYVCTTVQENTQSAGHQFDIIVTADDASTLNENARACLHDGDEYFAGCKLEAWKLKYTIDNDFTRFSWAGSESFFLVLDEMKYVRYPDLDSEGMYAWALFDEGEVDESDIMFTDTSTPSIGDIAYQDGEEYEIYYTREEGEAPNAKGVIYYMFDEFYNECGYDFKNIVYSNAGSLVYTFGGVSDSSLNGNCHHNVIPFDKLLPNNTFGDNCSYNTFGYNCRSNTLGNYCNGNTFGNHCSTNTFGDGCSTNTFGDSCYRNTFGNHCYDNTFGNNCYSNAFGEYCYPNTFGDGCNSNTFGDDFRLSTLGNYCNGNTFGNHCNTNAFGDDCSSNAFGDNCRYITFGKGCNYNTFGTSAGAKSYYRYITFEPGVKLTYLNCTATTSTGVYAQNVRVNSGVAGPSLSNRKTLTLATAGNEFLTTFGSANDTKIDV